MQLDTHQRNAVETVTGPLLIVAGPGAGKTLVLTHRAAALVKQDLDPQHILILTFTKAAQVEMKERVSRLVGADAAKRMVVSTFHALCYRIIRRCEPARPKVVDEGASYRIISEILQSMEMNADEDIINGFLHEYSNCVNRLLAVQGYQPKAIGEDLFRDLWTKYTAAKKRLGAYDFSDLLRIGYGYLRDGALRPLPFRFVMVDESQDVSLIQYRMTQILAQPENNLCLVGDDDQTIYSWRGAEPAILQHFLSDYPTARRIDLTINYRSTAKIVRAAANVIGNNQDRFDKALAPPEAAAHGVRPALLSPADEAEEAEKIVGDIRRQVDGGLALADIGVIYRTRWQAEFFIWELAKHDIPFRILGGRPHLLDHWVAKDLMAYLELALDPDNPGWFFHVLNRPGRYIDRDKALQAKVMSESRSIAPAQALDVVGLAGYQKEKVNDLRLALDTMKTISAREALDYVIHGLDYDQHLRNMEELGLRYRVLRERAMAVLRLAAPGESIPDFLGRIKDRRELDLYIREVKNGVTLTTCHSAKGLEFDVVYVAGAVDGVLPHKQALDGHEWGGVEEERRLFYVALTRAKSMAIISSPAKMGESRCKPSPFIDELAPREVQLEPGDSFDHPTFGHCQVRAVDASGDIVTVRLADASTKRLSVPVLLKRRILD